MYVCVCVCVYLMCTGVCLFAYMYGQHMYIWCPQRVSDLLELELQRFVSHHRVDAESSERAASALSHRASFY
jgi:hypothetical protein